MHISYVILVRRKVTGKFYVGESETNGVGIIIYVFLAKVMRLKKKGKKCVLSVLETILAVEDAFHLYPCPRWTQVGMVLDNQLNTWSSSGLHISESITSSHTMQSILKTKDKTNKLRVVKVVVLQLPV